VTLPTQTPRPRRPVLFRRLAPAARVLAALACAAGLCGAGAQQAGTVAPSGSPLAAPAGGAARPSAQAALIPNSFITLSYHEVHDEVRDYPDPYAVDSGALVAQFAWLRGNGFVPVSLQAVIDARNGGAPLPPKAVLLTFDDGYLSFYTRVFPLLRQFNYPAVLAVVGRWIEAPEEAHIYGEAANLPKASFPSWEQLKEIADSGLVEFASHSYDLHKGVPANPQGNVQPAAVTRIYDAASGAYESDAQWRERVRADLARNSDLIGQRVGKRPRAMVWPYGAYGQELSAIAAELGMTVGITLEDGPNTPDVPLAAMRRLLVMHNPPLAQFAGEMAGPRLPAPVRVVQVSLDSVYDPDPAQQERKLSVLLDRVRALTPTHVFLHAFSEAPEGQVGEAYFPNRAGAMRADLFNRVAWQLATRTDVKVCAALPAALADDVGRGERMVEDLARAADIDGVYFMPGAAGGDARVQAVASARMARAARKWRAPLLVARGVAQEQASAPVIAALAQGADLVVVNGTGNGPVPDLVALATRGRPAGEAGRPAQGSVAANVSTAEGASVAAVAPGQGGPARLVYLLDARGAAGKAGSGSELAERMRAYKRAGAIDFGYREDDFMRDSPELAQIAPVLAVRNTTLK
jgi:peptidoglycan/xylan/chitin deacetylase (PgdA/CDA1 family)